MQECTDPECDVFKCSQRHPRACNFFREYGRCKFVDYCRYKHAKPDIELLKEKCLFKIEGFEKVLKEKNAEIKTMKRELDTNKQKLKDLEKRVESKDIIVKEILENIENKVKQETLDEEIKNLRENTKKCFISLATKIDDTICDNDEIAF